jgi:hypothetical protein
MKRTKLADISIGFIVFVAWSSLWNFDVISSRNQALVARIATAITQTGWIGGALPPGAPKGNFTGPAHLAAAWLVYVTTMLPAIIAIVLIVHARRAPSDAETRCRKCAYILRGITEPRCPECGEKI